MTLFQKWFLQQTLLVGLLASTSTGQAETAHGSAWKYRMPVILTRRDASTAPLAPVDVTFSLFADRITDPKKEIRLVLETARGEEEVPFQLSRLSTWTHDTDGNRSLPTLNGMITFFDQAAGEEDARYFLLYGNPDITAPAYATDLKVSGTGPAWIIENSKMTVRLHGKKESVKKRTNHDSGQLSCVTLKAKPHIPFEPPDNVLHWNPGVFVPTRGWMHAFAWDPPEKYEVEAGPIFVEIRRSGPFPLIPEVHLAVNYRIFKDRAFVESGTVLSIQQDIGVVALRNDQLVFPEKFFTYVGWKADGEVVNEPLAGHSPINRHGDLFRISPTADYVAFYNPSNGVGAATVRDLFSAIGPGGAPPVLFDNATYITSHTQQYWFRPLVYFHVDWDRKQLITVPKESVYSERNYYLFFEPGKPEPLAEVRQLSRAVQKRPIVNIGEYTLPPDPTPRVSVPDFSSPVWTVSDASKGQKIIFPGPGTMEIFTPNGDGYTTVMRHLPANTALMEFSFDLTFLRHVDADGAGFAMNKAPDGKKIPRAVLHVRDQNFDIRGQPRIPWPSKLNQTYRLALRHDPGLSTSEQLCYGLFIDGKRAGTFSNTIHRVGFHITEAHVRIENARQVWNAFSFPYDISY